MMSWRASAAVAPRLVLQDDLNPGALGGAGVLLKHFEAISAEVVLVQDALPVETSAARSWRGQLFVCLMWAMALLVQADDEDIVVDGANASHNQEEQKPLLFSQKSRQRPLVLFSMPHVFATPTTLLRPPFSTLEALSNGTKCNLLSGGTHIQ